MEREEGRTDGVRERKRKQTWGKRQEEIRGGGEREGKKEWGAEMDRGEAIGCLVLIACAKSIVAD